jgi:hypothetical protein
MEAHFTCLPFCVSAQSDREDRRPAYVDLGVSGAKSNFEFAWGFQPHRIAFKT